MSFKIFETHVLAGTTALRGSHNHEGKPSHAQMGYCFCRSRLGRRTARLHRASGRFRVHCQDPALCLPRALRRIADLRPRLSGDLATWRRVLAAEREDLCKPRWACAGPLPVLTEQARAVLRSALAAIGRLD